MFTATRVMLAFQNYCVQQTNSGNSYRVDGKAYFYRESRRIPSDGGVCGSIWESFPDDTCRQVGTFKIDGSGKVLRGPAILKTFSNG